MTKSGQPANVVLAASDIIVTFGDVVVLDNVSVALEPGTLTAMVGPNGAGKTTALEALAGLRAPDEGTITRQAAGERTVAYLPQSPNFRDAFTAREVIEFYGSLVDSDIDADTLLARVGLTDAADRRADALSGGMTRLLGIAQALIGDPPIIVFDEPTSGLDPEAAAHIFEVARRMANDGRLVIVASHDLEAVQQLADRVLLLAGGEFHLDGAPATLLARTDSESLRETFSAAVSHTRDTFADGYSPTDGDL